jgi:hypothetical protein
MKSAEDDTEDHAGKAARKRQRNIGCDEYCEANYKHGQAFRSVGKTPAG